MIQLTAKMNTQVCLLLSPHKKAIVHKLHLLAPQSYSIKKCLVCKEKNQLKERNNEKTRLKSR